MATMLSTEDCVEVTCLNCGKTLRTPAKNRGKRGTCTCGSQISIPLVTSNLPARQQNKIVLLSVGVALCLALLVSAGLAFLPNPTDNKTAAPEATRPVKFDPASFANTQLWAAGITSQLEKFSDAHVDINPIVGKELFEKTLQKVTQELQTDCQSYLGTSVQWQFVITRIFSNGDIEFTPDYQGPKEFYYKADIDKQRASLDPDTARHLQVGDPIFFTGTIDSVKLINNSHWGWDGAIPNWDVCITLKNCAVRPATK